jgi:hypothetical protein
MDIISKLTASTLKPLLLFYAAVCILLYLFQDRLLFFPRSTPEANRDRLRKMAISINIGGLKVKGWLQLSKGPHAPFIIYYGGNAEEVSHTLFDSKRLKDASLLSVNYRGYGDSEGRPSTEKLIQDALYIFDYMVARQGLEPDDIVLMGRSLGSGVAVQVASRRRVGALILTTPFDSLENIAQHHFPIFPIHLLLRHNLDSLALAEKIDRPVLVIMAEKDKIVPKRYSENLISHWQGPVTVVTIPDAGHNRVDDSQAYWQAINDFIEKQVLHKGF